MTQRVMVLAVKPDSLSSISLLQYPHRGGGNRLQVVLLTSTHEPCMVHSLANTINKSKIRGEWVDR